MLTVAEAKLGGSRRAFLQVGGLGLAGLTLADLLAGKAHAAVGPALRDKSIIFLHMHGGPPQQETFDPKMSAPSGIRSATGETATSLPGVTFGGTFTKLAAQAKRMAVVRSFHTGNGSHDIKPVVCKETLNANLGSLVARLVGPTHPRTGMPSNTALSSRAIDAEGEPVLKRFGDFTQTGELGKAYAPFVPGAGGSLQKDMTLSLPRSRFDDRRALLSQLDALKRRIDSSGIMEGQDRFRRQAYETIVGGVADAFDLTKEDPQTVAAYDTAPLLSPEQISRKWNNHKRYVDHAESIGKLLLLARRLCEAGCRFVTVTSNFVWDMHADKNNATLGEGMEYVGAPFEHAVDAFLTDVYRRGLSDDILLVATGEIGRTPKINARGGRDHWGNLAPLMLAGGGLYMGQVIGQSTRDAGRPATRPYGNAELIATIMHTLFDVGQLRLQPGVPAEIQRVITGAQPITGLL